MRPLAGIRMRIGVQPPRGVAKCALQLADQEIVGKIRAGSAERVERPTFRGAESRGAVSMPAVLVVEDDPRPASIS